MAVREVRIPLLNPNEPEAVLVSLNVQAGQHVATGDVLCTVETTKSTHELTAESAGFVAGLGFTAGQMVNAGDLLCFLTDSLGETLPESAADKTQPGAPAGAVGTEAPPGLRITQPALALARQKGLDLNTFPVGTLVTEKMILARLEGREPSPLAAPTTEPFRILIFGGGGHAKAVIDLIRAMRIYPIAGILDDALRPGTQVLGVPVLGGGEMLESLYAQGVRLAANAVGGISKMETRIQVFERISAAGYTCPALVHPTAWVEPNATLGAGIQVFPFSYIGSEAQIGFGSIINTRAVVSHDCLLEDYVNLSPGALLAGSVHIGRGTLIGMGVTVNLAVEVGGNARIGNSAVIKGAVQEGAIVRAGAVFPQ